MAAEPYIVISAPNGARRDQTQHSQLPITPDELAECAEGILQAGASIMHLHVRDAAGAHSLEPRRYEVAIRAIRERVGNALVLQITTEACGIYTPRQQMQVVRELRPEAVSVALRELLPHPDATSDLSDFSRWLRDSGVMAQYILYTAEDASRYATLRDRGVLGEESRFVLFVLGSYANGVHGEPADIGEFCQALGDDAVAWAVCCFGARENEAARVAAERSGHARVGFENNLYMPGGDLAPDNAALVRLAAQQGHDAGRSIASADDVRKMFNAPG